MKKIIVLFLTILLLSACDEINTDAKDEILAKIGTDSLILKPIKDKQGLVRDNYIYYEYLINEDTSERIGISFYKNERELEKTIEDILEMRKMADGVFPQTFTYKNGMIDYMNDKTSAFAIQNGIHSELLKKHFTFVDFN